ncbi:MAG: TrkA C-terminal domain-containing protein, partial [Clostridia bacterium]
LEITSILKESGAKLVVSKTDREMHAKFLLKIGADVVIHPERDMAQRTAMKYSMQNAFDYIELTPEYAISETLAPLSWVGRTIRDLKVRSRYNVNVIGVKQDMHVTPLVDAEHVFQADEHILVAGSKADIIRIMYK